MTYNPGDALLGNGRRVKRGDTGTVGAVSNDRRGNNGDDSIGLFEWFVVNVCRVIVGVVVWTGINPLWKWLNNQKDNVNLWICDLFWMRVIFVLQNFATVSATKKRIASNAHTHKTDEIEYKMMIAQVKPMWNGTNWMILRNTVVESNKKQRKKCRRKNENW